MLGDMVWLCNAAHQGTAMKRSSMIAVATIAMLLDGCSEHPGPSQYGPDPQLPQPNRGLMPNMTIAEPASWGDQRPIVPKGYAISAIGRRWTSSPAFVAATVRLAVDQSALRWIRNAVHSSQRTTYRTPCGA